MEEDVGANLKAKLQPRRPGETLKVAQTVLKRRDRNLQALAKRQQEIAQKKKSKGSYIPKQYRIVKMETLLKESLNKIYDEKRLMNLKRRKRPKPVPKAQVLVVCRNGRANRSKKARSYLRGLRIRKRHHLTFILNTEDTARKLQVVEPYAFWGVPSFKNVYNLVHKKAVFVNPEAEDDKKIVLSDNMLIEKHLGDLGVLCTEDLAHVIHTGGKGFEEVMKRLAPVQMGDAKKADGMVRNKHYAQGDMQRGVNKVIARLMGE